MTLLFSENLYSWVTLLVVAVVAFALGLIIKSGVVVKQRKNILRLEDEMLSNHSRILALEKKISETRKDKGAQQDFDISTGHKKDRDLKAI